jgi:hypothetical protein
MMPASSRVISRASRGSGSGAAASAAIGNRDLPLLERGTRVAALFYSLIESAKLCGVEPRAYLREATLHAVRNPGTATLARNLKSSES